MERNGKEQKNGSGKTEGKLCWTRSLDQRKTDKARNESMDNERWKGEKVENRSLEKYEWKWKERETHVKQEIKEKEGRLIK